MKVAVFSSKTYDKEFLDKANAGTHEIVYFESSLRDKTIRLAEGFDVVCVFVNDSLTRPVIEGLAKEGVRLVALRSAGFNNIDLEAAAQCNIKIVRVPAYSPNGVAEHAVALILTLNRKIHKAYNRVREGNFSLERLTGFEIHGKTVGVIGTGRIGSAFALIMRGFGCSVLAYDKFPNTGLAAQGIKYCPLEELFMNSDIISLHCPLTPTTRLIINAHTIQMMKKGVMIINTGRGKLIDTDAAIVALKSGRIGYLGIDVYEQEERLFFKDLSEMIIQDDKIARLLSFPNVLITAHQAFLTDSSLVQIASTTIQNISDFEKGMLKHENEVSLEVVNV